MPDFHVKRCFLALVPDDVVIADLADLMDATDIEGVRLVAPDTLHVTVKFLGNVEDPSLPAIIAGLRAASSGVGEFELNVTGLHYLPDHRRPRVLAVSLDEPPPIATLFGRVEDACAKLGFRREGRPLHPHITIGRFKHPPPRHVPPLDDANVPATGWTVRSLTLLESHLGPGGPTYSPLTEFPLA
jgi:2'-5' RNA ligase